MVENTDRPIAAWGQRALVTVFCNFLVGYGESRRGVPLVFVLTVTQNLISIPLAIFESSIAIAR
jgi:hypothetical protein